MRLASRENEVEKTKRPGVFRRFLWESKAGLAGVAAVTGCLIGAGSMMYHYHGMVPDERVSEAEGANMTYSCSHRSHDGILCAAVGWRYIYPFLVEDERGIARKTVEQIFGKQLDAIPKTMDTVLTIYDWIGKNIQYEVSEDILIKTTLATRKGDCDTMSKLMSGLVTTLFGESTRTVSANVRGSDQRYAGHAYIEINLIKIYGQKTHQELIDALAEDLRRHYGTTREKAIEIIDREFEYNSQGVWLAFDATAKGIDGIYVYRRFSARDGIYYQTTEDHTGPWLGWPISK